MPGCVWFPDENHWILKPRNSRLWYGEFFAWLKAHDPGREAAAPKGRHRRVAPAGSGIGSAHDASPCLALAAALVAPAAQATELRLLSAGAVELGLTPALAVFERESGHVVRVEFAAAPALAERFGAPPASTP